MQKCWNCGTDQFDGTIFCSDCGASLMNKNPRRETTASLGQRTFSDEPHDAGAQTVAPQAEPAAPEPVQQPTTSKEFCFVILNSGQHMPMEPEKNLLVGRMDKARNIFPDVDLTNFGGYDAGVSRRHALLSLYNGHCVLEDLGSANGTFVNNQRVAPNQPTALNDGDEVKFGTLLLRIEFDQQSSSS